MDLDENRVFQLKLGTCTIERSTSCHVQTTRLKGFTEASSRCYKYTSLTSGNSLPPFKSSKACKKLPMRKECMAKCRGTNRKIITHESKGLFALLKTTMSLNILNQQLLISLFNCLILLYIVLLIYCSVLETFSILEYGGF